MKKRKEPIILSNHPYYYSINYTIYFVCALDKYQFIQF